MTQRISGVQEWILDRESIEFSVSLRDFISLDKYSKKVLKIKSALFFAEPSHWASDVVQKLRVIIF